MSEAEPTSNGSSVWARLPRILAIAGVLLLLGLLTYGLLSKGTSRAIDEKLTKGRASLAPSFDLALLDPGTLPANLRGPLGPAFADRQVQLRELRGTPLVLNFWASWCTPCREEAPRLNAGWERWGNKGVLFLGLNMQDLTGDAERFIGQFEISYPTIRDPGKGVADDYGTTGIPETFFITARGKVVGHVVGVVSTEQLDAGVRSARSGRVLGFEQGGAKRSARSG
jgi:cytochrome c biogenesis protein CcmG/thiol:disulfide interchange protein DsbE